MNFNMIAMVTSCSRHRNAECLKGPFSSNETSAPLLWLFIMSDIGRAPSESRFHRRKRLKRGALLSILAELLGVLNEEKKWRKKVCESLLSRYARIVGSVPVDRVSLSCKVGKHHKRSCNGFEFAGLLKDSNARFPNSQSAVLDLVVVGRCLVRYVPSGSTKPLVLGESI